MKHELLLVLALVLDVAGVVTVFVTIARARLRGGVLRHAGTRPAASGVKRGTDGVNLGRNGALSQPEPG